MDEQVSTDIQQIITAEIAERGNAVVKITSPWGKPVVLMQKALNRDREVPGTIQWWEYRSPHWDKSDWVAGWESTISGDKVCGPIE